MADHKATKQIHQLAAHVRVLEHKLITQHHCMAASLSSLWEVLASLQTSNQKPKDLTQYFDIFSDTASEPAQPFDDQLLTSMQVPCTISPCFSALTVVTADSDLPLPLVCQHSDDLNPHEDAHAHAHAQPRADAE